MIGDASNLPVKEFCYLRTNLLTAAVRKICLEEGWKGSKGKFQETSGEQEINPQRSEPDVGSQIYFVLINFFSFLFIGRLLNPLLRLVDQ